jgi:aspartate aminotransferase
MNMQKPVSLNLHVRGMGPSATLAINERVRELRRQGHAIYNLGLGQSPFPVPSSVVDALRNSASEKDYLPVKGLRELRGAVAEFHRQRDHIEAHPDGVIIGPGSKELMFLVQLAFYGEIIVESPCWVSYMPQARIIGRKLSRVHTSYETGWRVTAEQLLKSFEIVQDDSRPRLIVLNYPSNPTGLTYSPDELKELAEVCRRFGAIILSDEIYGELHHAGEHTSIAQFYPEGTIVSSGLSKWCGAGGWRLGTFCFPPELYWLLDALGAVASETYTSVCAPVQHAAVRAFRGGVDLERYLWHARRILAALGRECAEILRGSGVRVHSPVGAFYLFLDFTEQAEKLAAHGIHAGSTLCETLLEEARVAILPGGAFARSRSELSARLAYVDFDGARAMAAGENTPLHDALPSGFTRQYCERVIEGCEAIATWVKQL